MGNMDSLLKAIELCGGQASLARCITERLPQPVPQKVTPQQISNWLKRGRYVPAVYCPTIEKVCDAKVLCEELNPLADWEYLRGTARSSLRRRSTDPKT